MPIDAPVTGVAQVIQLAVAPVFLLSGVGVLLGVLTSRLARIVDRGRSLETKLPDAGRGQRSTLHEDLALLSRRARLMNWAISLGTTSALLVCIVIAALFVAAFTALELAGLIAALFVGAMAAFILALLAFLREIYLAVGSLRFGPPQK